MKYYIIKKEADGSIKYCAGIDEGLSLWVRNPEQAERYPRRVAAAIVSDSDERYAMIHI